MATPLEQTVQLGRDRSRHLASLLCTAVLAVFLPNGVIAEEVHRWDAPTLLTDSLSVYRKNYLLPVSWTPDDIHPKNTEVEFQISLQQRLLRSRFHVAYTQTAFWQVYDSSNERPFREVTHNPQAFYRLERDANPFAPIALDIGFDHTSNGQSDPESRGWDRAYLRPEYTTQRWRVGIMLWGALDRQENNEDISDFMGHHQLEVDWYVTEKTRLSWMSRYSFSGERGAMRLRATYPSGDGYLFLQVFHGYGESLIDYDQELTRVGIGYSFTR